VGLIEIEIEIELPLPSGEGRGEGVNTSNENEHERPQNPGQIDFCSLGSARGRPNENETNASDRAGIELISPSP